MMTVGRWLGVCGAMIVTLGVTSPTWAHVELGASLDSSQETPAPFQFTATLDTAQEVPPPTGSTATGSGQFALNADNTVRYSVTVQDLSGPPAAAHIHQGDTGVPGPVIVPLDVSGFSGTSGTITGTTAALTADQAAAFKAGGMYVNFHTALNPAGEVRGQIAAGFPRSGTAMFTLDQVAKTLQYNIGASNLSGDVVAVHLHQAPPGTPGPVVVPLDPSLEGATPALDDALITALLDGGLYVNLHTTLNPSGEIRGQVHVVNDPSRTCTCQTTTRKAFLNCVKSKIKALAKEDKKSAAAKALRRAVAASTCGKKKVGKKAIACCLAQTPIENIVVGRLCAAVTDKACAKRGGTSLGAGTSCLPTNPCTPPASPSGAFL